MDSWLTRWLSATDLCALLIDDTGCVSAVHGHPEGIFQSSFPLVGTALTALAMPYWALDLIPQLQRAEREDRETLGYLRRESDSRTIRVRCVRLATRGDRAEWVVELNVLPKIGLGADQRSLFDAFPVFASVVDLDQRYVRVNAMYLQAHPKKARPIVGSTMRELLGEEAYEIARPYVERVLAGQSVNYLHSNAAPGGERLDALVMYEPRYDRHQSIIGFYALVAPISRKLRLAESHRGVIELAADAIFIADSGGRYIEVNSQASRLTGYTRDELLGRDQVSISATPNARERLAEIRIQLLENDSSIITPWLLRHKQGHTIPVEVSARILPRGDWVAIARDVGERLRSAEKLEHAREAAETANVAKSEFLANMSHEIRSPMAAILGFAEVLSAQLTEPKHLTAVEIIRRNGKHLLEVINDILDLSRLEAGQLEVEFETFNLAELLLDVCGLMQIRAQEKGLDLSLDLRADTATHMTTDRRRLKQILINLVGNAVKFTAEGKVTLSATVEKQGADDASVRIDVVDTGPGIDSRQREQLFQPFVQLDGTKSRHHEGTGLGLAISQRLTQLLDGELWVNPNVTGGSVFSVRLAIAPRNAMNLGVESGLISGSENMSGTVSVQQVNGQFLVIDDRADMRALARAVIESAGGGVVTASDGRTGVELATTAQRNGKAFKVIVLDIQMPGMDGYATARELRRRGVDVPILALTAGAMTGDEDRALAAGCSDYLAKPIEAPELIAALVRHSPDRAVQGTVDS